MWDFFGDLAGHRALRTRSARAFAADVLANPDRYLTASLPALPFADRSFDLVLSSHLLFTYADRLDAAFHVAALGELLRVCRARSACSRCSTRAALAWTGFVGRVLAELPVPADIRRPPYEFQRGGNEMLVLAGTLTA